MYIIYYVRISNVEEMGWSSIMAKDKRWTSIRNYEWVLIPDLSRYYVKDYPVYTIAYYRELTMISSRHIEPIYADVTSTAAHSILFAICYS